MFVMSFLVLIFIALLSDLLLLLFLFFFLLLRTPVARKNLQRLPLQEAAAPEGGTASAAECAERLEYVEK